jgi:8-oxo-dGTP diphosphatase
VAVCARLVRQAEGRRRQDQEEGMRADRIEVVAAVICNERDQFLLAQRPAGKVYAGYWEFPGGKVEAGEAASAALGRELHEELGIDAITAYPWLTRDFDYDHAAVRLRFFRVLEWAGELHGRERQQFVWQSVHAITVAPLLPANGPILRALELPHVYGITCVGELGREAFMIRLERALQHGLRFVQVREKQLAADALRAFASEVVALAHRYGARVLVNGDAALAAQSHADGVHLTAAQLMAAARARTRDRFCRTGSGQRNAQPSGRETPGLAAVRAVNPRLSAAGVRTRRHAARRSCARVESRRARHQHDARRVVKSFIVARAYRFRR